MLQTLCLQSAEHVTCYCQKQKMTSVCPSYLLWLILLLELNLNHVACGKGVWEMQI